MNFIEINLAMLLEIIPFLFIAAVLVLGFFLTKSGRMEPSNVNQRGGLRYVMTHFPDQIDEVFISKKYRTVLNHLSKDGAEGRTAFEVAEELNLTTNIARGRLKHLFDKKYIGRQRAETLKPGVEFLYYPLEV